MRLIDADALMENAKGYGPIRGELCGYYDFAWLVSAEPTVDAVVLPCKVGDTVYRKDGLWDVVGFDCNRGGGWKVKLERWKDQFMDCHESTKVSFASFGKTIFLTREEAEAVLAKMKGLEVGT